ncbi:hypothetical protein FNV43_RR13309 [Rhamnella rubrinervis]|uniref:Cytochrome P450 n=1 Tax=Rhamnella rubrinervis TaxID=2594499 RepID=A0A8K0H0W7_9ROSA|nr:hypothetical protein FNV43_RR13309 [Rhamnella rubrinervis]
MLNDFSKLNGAFYIGDWIPWLAFLDLHGCVRKMKALEEKFDHLFDFVYDGHKANREAAKSLEPRDMVGLLVELMDDPSLDVKPTYDSVKGFTQAETQHYGMLQKNFVRRFLEGKLVNIDVKGQSFELIPFGSGRRMCPGYSLALKMLMCGLANMLHGFNWSLPCNMKIQDLSMEEDFGISTPRKVPLVAVLEPRLPRHLYQQP